jgi:hypothetical protein
MPKIIDMELNFSDTFSTTVQKAKDLLKLDDDINSKARFVFNGVIVYIGRATDSDLISRAYMMAEPGDSTGPDVDLDWLIKAETEAEKRATVVRKRVIASRKTAEVRLGVSIKGKFFRVRVGQVKRWVQIQRNNFDDPYSRRVINLVKEVGKLLSDKESIDKDDVQRAFNLANYDGVSGAQAGTAFSILKEIWANGNKLPDRMY